MRGGVVALSCVGALALPGCGRIGFDTSTRQEPPTFADLCSFTGIATITNGLPADDGAGTQVATALASGCRTSPVIRTVSQNAPGILDAAGRPRIDREELAVIGGGDGPNRAIAYLLEGDTPLVWSGDATATIRERATGRMIVTGPISSNHDYAFVMVIVEPISGVRVLSAQGLARNGTIAAGQWFADQLAPHIATDTTAWSVVEWTDSDGVNGPTTGDTFDVIETGR